MFLNVNGRLVAADQPHFTFAESHLSTTALIEEQLFFNGLECRDYEAHYFSIMAAMRMFRRSIPMEYTPEFILEEIQKTIKENGDDSLSLVRFYSGTSSLGIPNYYISVNPMDKGHFKAKVVEEIDVFKDFYWHSDFLSGIRLNSLPLLDVARAYCRDHHYADCMLINERKELVMTLKGYAFLRFGQAIKTPSESSGVYRGVFRSKVIDMLKTLEEYTVEESVLNPFDLQRADELMIISQEGGLFSVNNYRKTSYKGQSLSQVEQGLMKLI